MKKLREGISKQLPMLRTLVQRRRFLDLRRRMFREEAGRLAELLRTGKLTLADWQIAMKAEIKSLHVTSAVAGNGGAWGAMAPVDWGRVGANCKKQYGYLGRFAEDIHRKVEMEAWEMTTSVDARAKLYDGAAAKSFYKTAGRAEGWPDLPAQPGDFQCDGNCRCEWDAERTEEGWEFTWVCHEDLESCAGCLAAAGRWNPLFIPT